MEEAGGGGKVARRGRDGRYGGIPPSHHIGKAGGDADDPAIRLPQPEDRMAAKKTTSKKKPGRRRKAASPKSAGKKPASRKTAARKGADRKPTGRKTKTAAARRRRVATAVKATARRGLDAAKEGFGRIKSATTHLVEAARDRLAGDEPAPG